MKSIDQVCNISRFSTSESNKIYTRSVLFLKTSYFLMIQNKYAVDLFYSRTSFVVGQVIVAISRYDNEREIIHYETQL